MDAYPFPPELVSPKDKEKPWYGLQHVKAAYYTNNRYGFRTPSDNLDYQSLIEFAQGRQSVTNLRKLFGLHANPNDPGAADGPESLAYIDVQTLNLAPKYINRAVAKMQQVSFDISLESIDLSSVDEKQDYAGIVAAFYRLKEWVESMQIPLHTAFPGIDVNTMPDHPDELMWDLSVNPKIKKEIAGEKALKLVMWINNFKQKMREIDWDLVVFGKGHLHIYHDHNMIPRMDRINPKYWFGSYVENDDFEQQEYAGFVECITVNQFIREASGEFKQDELQAIVSKYGIKNSAFTSISAIRTLAEYDNLSYIPVVRWYFLSEDNRTFITRKNQYGNLTLMDRAGDYIPKEDKMERFGDGGDSRLIKTQYTSVYGGSWVIDSDIVFNYGRKPYPRTNLVEQTLPIKTFATNFKEGRYVSFASQMVEPVFMINVAWNKIKETLAKGWIGIRNIDLTAIEAVALGKGGATWTPREVIEFLNITNTAVGRRNAGNQYGQSNGDIVTHTATGVQLADHFNTLTMAINILEQMTSTSIIESANVPDRISSKAVMESKLSGSLDMEYLYNAHNYLYERAAHQILLLTQESKRNAVTLRAFVPALGKVNSGYYEVPEDIAYCEYGMVFSRQPGAEEWAEFYQDVRIALQEGKIGLSDSVYLREIDNLKEARQMMAIREKQYKREIAKEAQQNNDMAMEANSRAAKDKIQGEIAKMQQEAQIKAELMKLEGAIKSKLQKEKAAYDAEINNVTLQMKKVIAAQEGTDDIMKHGVRNVAENYKTDKQAESKIVTAQVQAETALKTAGINAAAKAKSKSDTKK